MLTRDALNSALPLTQALDEAGVFLTPVEGTPLAVLTQATRSDDNFVTGEAGSYMPDINSIEYMANVKDETFGCSPHDKVMDEITDVAVKAVQGHINFARSVVRPAVQELAEKTQASLNELEPSALTGMEVVVWNPPAPLLNASLESSVRRFEEVPYDSPAMLMRLPDRTVQEIVEIMQSGAGGLDGDIRDWAAEKGDSFFIQLWENMFQQKQAELNDAPRQFIDYMACPGDGLDYALGVYLIARRLTDEPLEGTEMPLGQYNNLIVDFRNQAGRHLVHAIDDLDRSIKSGILVRSAEERVTVVNGPVYKDWIETGGENEVLFGNMLNLPGLTTAENISENAGKLKALWNRHVALTATVENNRRFSRTKALLERHFRTQVIEAGQEDPSLATNVEVVINLFREQLDRVRENDLQDLYDLCLRLVCRSRFAHTDAERILAGIERVQKENPQIDVREAAAISVIEYVAFWVAAQFKINAR